MVEKMKIFNYREVEAEKVTEEGAKGTTVRWLIDEKIGAKNFFMRLFEMEPGGYSPLHTHPWEHEVFILEGEGTVVSKEGEHKVGPGDVIYIPPNEKHQLKNTGKTTFKFLCLIPSTK